MAEILTNQLERLSYTRRDLALIDEEVDRFITQFIPTIRSSGKANVGRQFVRILEALVDKLNYSLDMKFRRSVLRTASELQDVLDIAELVRYSPVGASAASTDLRLTTLTGPAGPGGLAIAQYTIFSTNTSPVRYFISLDAAVIPEGSTELYPLSVVEGTRIVDQVIKASTDGVSGEEISMPVALTPHEYLEVSVDGVAYTQVQDFRESQSIDLHVMCRYGGDEFTTLLFGDGEYGRRLSSGQSVTATYLQCSGEDGIVAAAAISRVVGGLSSLISASNPEASAGGSNGDTVDDVVRKAPLQAAAVSRATSAQDFAALAQANVSGVFQAVADEGDGSIVRVYILPDGGGVASATLLTAVEAYLSEHCIHGAIPIAYALTPADLWIKLNVLLQNSRLSKAVARTRLYEAIAATKLDGTESISGMLYYRNMQIGRGIAMSDLLARLESLDDSTLVDYASLVRCTRYLSPQVNNLVTTVQFVGTIVPLEAAGYDTWSVQALTPTTYNLYRNGVIDSSGTIGVSHTSAATEVQFTIGLTTDNFLAGDAWTFLSSPYRNDIVVSKYEFPRLAQPTDLEISIFYPGELGIGA